MELEKRLEVVPVCVDCVSRSVEDKLRNVDIVTDPRDGHKVRHLLPLHPKLHRGENQIDLRLQSSEPLLDATTILYLLNLVEAQQNSGDKATDLCRPQIPMHQRPHLHGAFLDRRNLRTGARRLVSPMFLLVAFRLARTLANPCWIPRLRSTTLVSGKVIHLVLTHDFPPALVGFR